MIEKFAITHIQHLWVMQAWHNPKAKKLEVWTCMSLAIIEIVELYIYMQSPVHIVFCDQVLKFDFANRDIEQWLNAYYCLRPKV